MVVRSRLHTYRCDIVNYEKTGKLSESIACLPGNLWMPNPEGNLLLTIMPPDAHDDLAELFTALSHSKFRRGFRLGKKESDYLQQRGLPAVLEHAAAFVEQRLSPASPTNDGKQTPWRGHPVFVAQHATATCCRGCLAKWHHIPRGRQLTEEEQQYIVRVIGRWLETQK